MKRGRKPMRPEDKVLYKTKSISGKPAELSQISALAKAANKTFSRYVIESLLPNYKESCKK